jgi:hypothetical protein
VTKHDNLLEFIAAIISVLVEILNYSAAPKSCFPTLDDNASSVGWLHTYMHLQSASPHDASILMKAQCCLYSQHMKGVLNNVADALSRFFHMSDIEIINSTSLTYHDQLPECFSISPLPPEISYG